MKKKNTLILHTVDGRVPAPVDIWIIYIYTDFPFIYEVLYIHPRWCRISSINSIIWLHRWISSKPWHTSHIATLLNPDEFHIRELLRYILGAILKTEKVNIIIVQPQPSWKLRPYIPFFPINHGTQWKMGVSKNEFPFHLAQFSTEPWLWEKGFCLLYLRKNKNKQLLWQLQDPEFKRLIDTNSVRLATWVILGHWNSTLGW